MKRIIIDLTDIESWHGHHGGTQRVVYGIAKQFFLSEYADFIVEYMSFSAAEDAFYKTRFDPIFDRTEAQANTSPQQRSVAALTFKSRVKYLVRPYIPEKVRTSKYARATAKKVLRLGKDVARKGRLKIKRSSHPLNVLSRQEITFTENDVVLILGKPWDNPNMEQALIVAKADTGFKLVQVIYDLIIPLYPHLHHPSLFKNYTQYVYEAIYGSDLLLPISKSSNKDLKLFAKSLNLPSPKTKVIRLADEITAQQSNAAKPDDRIAERFIACIGTIEIRKNHTLLYYAYKLAEQQGIKLPQLVIVGSRGWLTGDLQYLVEHDPKVKDKIIILDNANDQALSWVYANCMFSVYPSFYEGWGLPVAESLANGKVCIASEASSIPEIAGNMIDYFSPYDAQACLNLVIKHLDPATLKKRGAQIKETYRPTSWDNTFKEIRGSINEL